MIAVFEACCTVKVRKAASVKLTGWILDKRGGERGGYIGTRILDEVVVLTEAETRKICELAYLLKPSLETTNFLGVDLVFMKGMRTKKGV